MFCSTTVQTVFSGMPVSTGNAVAATAGNGHGDVLVGGIPSLQFTSAV